MVEAVWCPQVAKTGLTQSKAKGLEPELQVGRSLAADEQPHAGAGLPQYPYDPPGLRGSGLLPPGTVIPDAKVVDEFIQMDKPDEWELYERIRTYIKRSYNRYMTGAKPKRPWGSS